MDSSSLPTEIAGAESVSPAFALLDTVANDTAPFLLKDAEISAVPETEFAPPSLRATAAPHETLQRAFDVSLALIIISFLLPLMTVCALAIRLSGPGPLLFRQTRIGRDGREFQCLKFRTMNPLAEQNLDSLLVASVASREQWELLHKLSQDPRTTPVGRFLRRYSLDELPQLFNVLRGDMSIVGPRPIVDAEVARYGASFTHYCSVKPGLTGLWQVSGRHALTYEERVMLDARYAISKSLRGDLRILMRTVPVVVLGQNE
jgi:lipopolysaccharide/colanic/teichoic acid biosynthesis glycosyltransferase